MNRERRQYLERLFDGELLADDPPDAAEDAESLAYLTRLGLLRQLALRHDPAAASPPRPAVFVAPRPRRRIFATILALAAGASFIAWIARPGRRPGRDAAAISAAPTPPPSGTRVAVVPIGSPRSPRPPLEVELYRWANESTPYRDDAAGVVLSRVGSLAGRPSSREILALELANATPGSTVKLPRWVASPAPAMATPGSIRKAGSPRRHRSSHPRGA